MHFINNEDDTFTKGPSVTRLCWFCLLSVNRTRVLSQATSRSPVTEQQATATGRSDRGISMISICTPPRTDAPRSRWPNSRTPTRAFSSAWRHSQDKVKQGSKASSLTESRMIFQMVEGLTLRCQTSLCIFDLLYLVAPVGVGPQVGGIVLLLNGHQVVSWMREGREAGE